MEPPTDVGMDPDDFRSGLREWLDANNLSAPADPAIDVQLAHVGRVRGELYRAGWMRYGWPPEVGGLGGAAILRSILGEDIVSREIAHPAVYSVVEVLAPSLITYAPKLAATMIPGLLAGQEHWCQGFSEPEAGSDLAAMTTRASRSGDDWVVNGQKVWTSLAQFATRCVLLARTGPADVPAHQAISAFFIDMDSPGITVRPLRSMHGADEFAEVYFDDVPVPGDRVIGEPGMGWAFAMDLLPYERSTCFWHRIAYLFNRFDELLTADTNADSPFGDAMNDSELGATYLALHTARCRSHATQLRFSAGERLGPETSVDKVLLSTAEQQVFDTARNLRPGAIEFDDTRLRMEYLYSRAATIYGGTAEIQRNIIARRFLELGRE